MEVKASTFHATQPAVKTGSFPVLVLNADYRPLSYFPLSIWAWQEAVKAVFMDRVNIVATYEQSIRSPSFEMRLPSVVSLKSFVLQSRKPAFTRFNVFLRDRFSCQYCGSREDLTFDHVVPKCKGGKTRWDNIVTACSTCNIKKGSALPEEVKMWPRRRAWEPSSYDLQRNGRMFPPNHLHESWMDYLYWDTELEP
ncbi:MAG: HNH endonuclease [Methylobacteriaceae bacterium]|nr:HNH endonuclease [Methylobacteriaceae bacterium]